MLLPTVLKLHPHYVAVHKPPGLSFHSDQPGVPGLAATLRSHHLALGLPPTLFPSHRLDLPTSGVVLFARSRDAAGALAAAFREGRVVKYYVALSCRRPAKKMGTVAGDMARGRRGGWMLRRSTENPAVTRFWSTSLGEVRPGLRMYLLRPLTGRTHQLRVAMKSLGAPILGDAAYAEAGKAALEERTYLHAAALRVCLPGGDALQVVCAPRGGALFEAPPVRAAFEALLPQSLERDLGVWLPDLPLLASGPLEGAAGQLPSGG